MTFKVEEKPMNVPSHPLDMFNDAGAFYEVIEMRISQKFGSLGYNGKER
jgi:hypothetical protein